MAVVSGAAVVVSPPGMFEPATLQKMPPTLQDAFAPG